MAPPQPELRLVTGRILALALVLATAACGGSAAHASKPSPSPSASPSATVTVLPPSTPSGPADLPVTQVGFTCRLPAVVTSGGGNSVSYQGGLLGFPAATFVPDANGVITAGLSPPEVSTQAGPVLSGVPQDGPTFYDAALHRWVPVSSVQASPDGSSYAYVGNPAGLRVTFHIVEVATATEKTFTVAVPNIGTANGVQVMDYDGSGVFFAVTQVQADPVGVWRLDARAGSVTALARVANVMAVRAGYAWAGVLDPHDPNPPTGTASGPLFNSIVQVNLSNGAQTAWYYSPGRSQTLLGLASSRIVINIADAPDFSPVGGEVRLLDHPSTGAEDSGQLLSGGGVELIDPQADGDRVWFGSDRGIYLYTPDGGLQKVFAFAGSSATIAPAGPCR